jgi:hypothetical protein
MNMSKDKYFKTTSFYVAIFLSIKGLELVDIDKTADPKRARFVFIDSPERKLWLESFNFGKENAPEVMIDVRKFVTTIKTLKDKLYQDKF